MTHELLPRIVQAARGVASAPYDAKAIAFAASTLDPPQGQHPAARLGRACHEMMQALPLLPAGARGPALLALSKLAFALDMTLKLPELVIPCADKPYYRDRD